jgi:DNA-binding response OmpR family regulator
VASRTILVADDNTVVVKMLKTFLEQEGFKVITAYDGQEALDKGYKEKPDLILLDIGMPKINGYLVCKKLKGDVKTKGIPIFMLTVKGNESDKTWGLGMGADEYLDKSIEPVELIKILKERLRVE